MKKITYVLAFFLAVAFSWQGTAQTFTGATGAVPDDSCPVLTDYTNTVTGVGVLGITNVLDQVKITISHSWGSDLNVYLTAPDGTQVELTTGNGGSGTQYINTIFRADAAESITTGSGDFTGTWLPEGDLADFNGIDADGDWTLNVCDSSALDIGSVDLFEITFVTAPCFIFTAPYTEGFEDAGTFCWTNDVADQLDWTVISGGTPSSGTGPSAANGGTYYIYVEASGSSSSDAAVIYSPNIDLSALTTPRLKFYYHMFGTSMDPDGSIDVAISTDNGVTYTYIFDQAGNQGDQWNEGIVDLSAYSGVVSFRITGMVSSTGLTFLNDFAIDDFVVEEAPSCIAPVNLTVTNIDAIDVDIAWDVEPNAASYDWEIQPTGNVQGDAGSINLGTELTNSVTDIAGPFTTGASYTLFVRSNCDLDGNSTYSNTIFNIPFGGDDCATAEVIMPGSFTDTTINNGTGGGAGDTAVTRDAVWFSYTPTADGTIDVSSCLGGADTRLWIHSGTCAALVAVADNDDACPFEVGNSSQWASEVTNVSVTAETEYFIEWDDRYSLGPFDWSLTFTPLPSCPTPIALTATSITDTTANLAWTENGTATTWNVEVGATPFTPTGTATNVGVSNPFTLSGLTTNIEYEYYVQADCGLGELSTWTGPYTFTTACPTFTTPYTEDFEDAGALDSCWINDSADQLDWTARTGSTPSPNTGPAGANGGTYYIYVESTGSFTSDAAVIYSPNIDLSALTTPQLSFYYHMYGAAMDPDGSIDVAISTDGGIIYTSIFNQVGNLGNQWNNSIVDLSAYSGVVSFRVTGTVSSTGTAFENDFAIDDFVVEEAPPCSEPANLAVTNIDIIDVDIAWDIGPNAVDYDWEIQPEGAAQGNPGAIASGTNEISNSVVDVAGPFTLSANYTLFVKSNCGLAGSSIYNSIAFNILVEGDNCANTIDLDIETSPLISTTVGATNDFGQDCLTNPASLDLVYSITVPDNYTLVIGQTASSYDSKHRLAFGGACPGTTLIDCVDDPDIGDITWANTTGADATVYWIQSAYSGSGDFTLAWTLIASNCSGVTTTWDGAIWSNGTPTSNDAVVINGLYETGTHGNLEACTLLINATHSVIVEAGGYVRVQNDITVDGTIDVQHEGSIVQVDDLATVTNNGTINVIKTTPVNGGNSFSILGSPMSGTTRGGAYVDNNVIMYHSTAQFNLDPAVTAVNSGAEHFADVEGDNWQFISNGATSVFPSEGYLVGPTTQGVIDSQYNLTYNEGTLNNGVYSFNTIYNNVGTTAENKSNSPNILSNPYASAIDATMLITNNTVIDEIYFWEHLTAPSGSYPGYRPENWSMGDISIRNAGGGVVAPNGGAIPTQYIASGQGFAIKANAAETVTFNNALRVTGNNTGYRNPETERIYLRISNETYGLKSTALIAFTQAATNGYEAQYDTKRLATPISIYTVLEERELAIQGRSVFTTDQVIPLGFRTMVEEEQTYIISLVEREGDNINVATVYLQDNLLNIVTNLSETTYSFTSNESNQKNRFVIVFEEEQLESNEVSLEAISVYPNPTKGLLSIISPLVKVNDVIIYDISGRTIATYDFTNKTDIKVNLSNLNSTVYFVKINTENGSVTKQIIKE